MDALKKLLDGFQDPAALLPELDGVLETLVPVIRFAVALGPLVLLILGLCYLFLSPKEANHSFGFRCWWGMSSVEVWRFTQKLAGIVWTAMGLVLGLVAVIGSMGYGALSPDLMLIKALTTILWQLALVIVSILAIHLTLIFLFDGKGRRRGSVKETLK